MRKQFTIEELQAKLTELGLIKDGKAISLGAFRKLADIHTYGHGRNSLRVLYFGPKDNKFGFYPMRNTTAANHNECYEMLKDVAAGELMPYVIEDICYGNCGIPLAYGNLRYVEHTNEPKK